MTDQMLPGDRLFAAITDEFVAAMLANDTERAARALSTWTAEAIKRTNGQGMDAARIFAGEAARQAVVPLEVKLDHALATLSRMETRQIQIYEHFAAQVTALQTKVIGLERRVGGDG